MPGGLNGNHVLMGMDQNPLDEFYDHIYTLDALTFQYADHTGNNYFRMAHRRNAAFAQFIIERAAEEGSSPDYSEEDSRNNSFYSDPEDDGYLGNLPEFLFDQ